MRFSFPFRCTFIMELNNVIVQLAICEIKPGFLLRQKYNRVKRILSQTPTQAQPRIQTPRTVSLFLLFSLSQSSETHEIRRYEEREINRRLHRSWEILILVLVLTPTLTLFTRLNAADGSTIRRL